MAGFVANSLFFVTPGPFFVESTAVSVQLTLLLSLRALGAQSLSFASSSSSSTFTLRRIVAFASGILTILLGLSGQTQATAWSALLLILVASSFRTTVVEEQGPKPAARWSYALDIVTALLLVLMCNGAAVATQARLLHRPSTYGNLSPITLGDGSTVDVFWHCEGGTGPQGSPGTLMLDSDASHGAADMWPLQRSLAKIGLRSCVFDKPGQGWSSPWTPDQHASQIAAYPLIFDVTGEAFPLRLVGWGGGGENIYQYALDRPTDVQELIFLDTCGSGVEWRAWAFGNDKSVTEMMEYREADLASRRELFGLIRFIMVPWGLYDLIIGGSDDPSGYAWPERYDAYRSFYKTALTWTTQWFTLQRLATEQGGYLKRGFLDYHGVFDKFDPRLSDVRVLHLISQQQPLDAKAGSDVERSTRAYYDLDREVVAGITNAGTMRAVCVEGSEAQCNQDFPLRYPDETAKKIADWILSASAPAAAAADVSNGAN
jgi:pimeloyl-ACP methyl ester carboxylesterase